MKIVILDDKNLILLLGGLATHEYMDRVQSYLRDELPGWNCLVFGGLAGEIIDLRGHEDLAEKAAELYGLIERNLPEVI